MSDLMDGFVRCFRCDERVLLSQIEDHTADRHDGAEPVVGASDGTQLHAISVDAARELEARRIQVATETTTPSDSLWWLSFADAARPAGSQFLGACLLEATNLPAAVTASHLLGINPGGAVQVVGPIPPDQIPSGWPLNRLLSRDEIDALEARGSNGTS